MDDRCRTKLNDDAKLLFVILGDSYANALTTIFDALAVVSQEFSRYIKIGRELCPLVSGIGDTKYQALTETAIFFTAEPTGSKYVVLAGQWSLHINRNSLDAQIERSIQGLEQTITTLQQAGNQVVFTHTMPLGVLPRTRTARIPGKISGDCSILSQTMFERENGYKSLVSGVLEKFGVKGV